MEIVRVAFARSPKQLSREVFCEQLRRILAEQFPDEIVERVTIAAVVPRAFLAVLQGELPDAIESRLTFGLLWLQRARPLAPAPSPRCA
jgi:hypothetical protein